MAYDTPEGKVKQEGRQLCRSFDLYYFPVNQGGTSKPGIPDDTVNFWGLFGHIEYKAHMRWDKNNVTAHKTLPTDQQCRRMEECRSRGGITLVVDDTNIMHLKQVLINIRSVAQLTMTPDHLRAVQRVAQDSVCGWNWTYEDYNNYKEGRGGLLLPKGMTIPVYQGAAQ